MGCSRKQFRDSIRYAKSTSTHNSTSTHTFPQVFYHHTNKIRHYKPAFLPFESYGCAYPSVRKTKGRHAPLARRPSGQSDQLQASKIASGKPNGHLENLYQRIQHIRSRLYMTPKKRISQIRHAYNQKLVILVLIILRALTWLLCRADSWTKKQAVFY